MHFTLSKKKKLATKMNINLHTNIWHAQKRIPTRPFSIYLHPLLKSLSINHYSTFRLTFFRLCFNYFPYHCNKIPNDSHQICQRTCNICLFLPYSPDHRYFSSSSSLASKTHFSLIFGWIILLCIHRPFFYTFCVFN